MVSALYKTETLTGADVRKIIEEFEKEHDYETMLQPIEPEETQKDEVKKDLNLEKTSSKEIDLNE